MQSPPQKKQKTKHEDENAFHSQMASEQVSTAKRLTGVFSYSDAPVLCVSLPCVKSGKEGMTQTGYLYPKGPVEWKWRIIHFMDCQNTHIMVTDDNHRVRRGKKLGHPLHLPCDFFTVPWCFLSISISLLFSVFSFCLVLTFHPLVFLWTPYQVEFFFSFFPSSSLFMRKNSLSKSGRFTSEVESAQMAKKKTKCIMAGSLKCDTMTLCFQL